MAEFTGGNEEYISVREPIVFENKTESQYEVCTGIVFHKSGIYEVSVVGNKTIVSEVPKRKTGKWIKVVNPDTNEWVGGFKCSECDRDCIQMSMNYCANCGAPMKEEEE